MCLGLGFLAALVVPEGANPDEWNHLGALRWFETHWTAPELGSPEVFYDGYGLSRVWYGEAVYPVYGTLGRVWRWLVGHAPPMLLYRLLNVALLPLLVVMVARLKELEGAPTTMFLVGVAVADPRTRRLRWVLLAAHLVLGVAVAAALPFAVPAP